jgi:Tfp pilus assembly protein PilP
MRPLLFTLLFTPLVRPIHTHTLRAITPVLQLQYPICRRNLTCSVPGNQDLRTTMSDLKTEGQEEVERLANPAPPEAEILECNRGREEALKQNVKEEDIVAQGEEEKLPKLSAADFRVYNSMAEHMDYFVRFPILVTNITAHPTHRKSLLAQPFSPILDSPLHGMHNQSPPLQPLPQTIPLNWYPILLTPFHPPCHRRAAHLPLTSNKNARI